MNVGIIGLGRMGHAIAKRIHQAGHIVVGFDVEAQARAFAETAGITTISAVEILPDKVDVIWLMLPAGDLIDQTLAKLKPRMKRDMIIIDGGNSNYKDSIRRAHELAAEDVQFLDCGTSGGLQGAEDGFSLMLGGQSAAYLHVVPLLKAVAAKNGYGLVGPHGAGHYVKSVHNGIEYGILQAYAEGFQVLKEGHFKNVPLDLAQISDIWMHGSIIRSYLLQLAHEVFIKDQRFDAYSGYVAEGGTGLWTKQEADAHAVPVPVLDAALQVRAQSRTTGGNFATKLIAMIRCKFGGHSVKMKSS
jgi:6-phosphogluconate dehydrogenase